MVAIAIRIAMSVHLILGYVVRRLVIIIMIIMIIICMVFKV